MTKFKKFIAFSLVLAMLLLAGCATETGENGTENEPAKNIDTTNAIALVNEEVVDINTFNIFYSMHETVYKQYYGEDIMDQEFQGVKFSEVIKEEVVNTLIEDSLIRSYIQSTGYSIDPELYDTKFAELKTLLEEDEESKAMYDEIGVDDEFLKMQVESSIILEEFSKVIEEMIESDQEQLETLYENFVVEVKASHILVEDEALALEIKSKLDAGEDFAALVTEFSTDTGSVAAGGSLGYFTRGVIVPEFEAVAFSQPVGVISEPVASQFGYHIIKVEDIKTVNQMVEAGDDEELIVQYKDTVKSTLFSEFYAEKIEELKAAATIETYLEKVAPKTEE
jgi:foldase protein PrsA